MGKKDTRTDSEATEGSRSCCRCRLVLVVLQTLLGMASTALALYLYLYVPATKLRDAPLWASGPLCVAGLVGIFYCATDFHVYAGSTKAFVIKTLCLMFSTLATFLCLIATVFPVIHLVRIFTYHRCREEEGDCVCALTSDPNPKVVVYDGLAVCDVVFTELQYSLIVSGSLCLLGSVASLWFVVLVWQGRYGRVYTGLDSASPTPIPEVIITEADLSPS